MHAGAPFVERGLDLPMTQLKIRRFDWREPIDEVVFDGDRSYFDMCLTPRPRHACGSYLGRFAPSDYEPLGRLMFVPAGLPLRARAGSGRQWALQCWFASGAFEDLAAAWDGERLRESLHVASPSLLQVSDRIVAEMTTPGFASAVVIEALCSIIAVDLARHFSQVRAAVAAPQGGLPGWRLRRIEERVRDEGRPPTLDELGALCALSPRHLTRAFRQQTGRSLGAFIAEARIARAKALLAADDVSLKEVSEALGFAQVSAFSTAFRRVTGERPSACRARLRAERRTVFPSASHNRVH